MKPQIAACLLALVAGGCLENEEQIDVRPDGSLAVTLTAKGDVKDLCAGYALPTGAPWVPANDAMREWLAAFAPDTGGPQARARLVELAGVDPETELVVSAELRSADELPRFFAPESEPYRTAYLERDARLSIERRGRRTVYTFERVYRGRTFAQWDVVELARKRLAKEQVEKLREGFVFTDEEWPAVAGALIDAYAASGRAFVRSALSSIYTQGDASLAPEAAGRVLARAEEGLRMVVTRDVLDRVRALVLETKRPSGSEAAAAELKVLLERVESDGRGALRAVLDRGLAAEGVDARVRNAVRAQLEWAFTAHDHTSDLGDERFKLKVRMPGVIVDGNHGALEGESAVWELDGSDLHDRERVMRVVSVL